MTDYTDTVARFTDQLAAETLAKFIASAGIPCDVTDVWDPVVLERYCVRVPRSRIAELKNILRLTPVARRLNATAAQVIAARLARENVPCYVGGWHSFGAYGDFTHWGDDPLKETKEPGAMIAVPASLVGAAVRVLNQSPISEDELSELALRAAPDPQDPT